MCSATVYFMVRHEFQITAGPFIGAALGVLLLPLNWLLGWLIAVTVHEAGHIIMLKLCRVPIHRIRIGLRGVEISVTEIPARQELICAAAGPIFSFMLLFLAQSLPAAAMIGLVQGMFNLLPIPPLDGWRMLRSVRLLIRERFA